MIGKTQIEMVYCVPWGYHATVAWMANEFFREFGPDVAIKLTPGIDGRLEVYQDGKKIFDRKQEGGKYPDLARVRELKAIIKNKLQGVTAS